MNFRQKQTWLSSFLLFPLLFGSCITEQRGHEQSEVNCTDTLNIKDSPRYFTIVHSKEDTTLTVALSDSLKNATFSVSHDSTLKVTYLLDNYFKGFVFEPEPYHAHDDDDTTSVDDAVTPRLKHVTLRYTTFKDTSADMRIDNLRILPGTYFSAKGGCVKATIVEIKFHRFRDRVHAYTPNYLPLAFNETDWYIIQKKNDGTIAFSYSKDIRNPIYDSGPGHPIDERIECKLNLNYSLAHSIPVVCFEYQVFQEDSHKKEIELYAIGEGFKQILSIPAEASGGSARSPGSFTILPTIGERPANIRTTRQIIRGNDTVSNMMEEYYWEGKYYSLKERKELVTKKQ